MNYLYPGMLCAKFCFHWPSGSEEEVENVKSLHKFTLSIQLRSNEKNNIKEMKFMHYLKLKCIFKNC